MTLTLDIDAVCAGHPEALAELARLREIERLTALVIEWCSTREAMVLSSNAWRIADVLNDKAGATNAERATILSLLAGT